MIKKSKRYLSAMLTGAILLSNVTVNIKVSAETLKQDIATVETTVNSSEYEIYPAPQKIEYTEGSFNLSNGVNVVYEEGVDQATKNRLENEILKLHNITYEVSLSSTISNEKSNILVGIDGSEGVVDKYAEKYTLSTEKLFEKTDAYFLAVENNTITILGKDTDAAFYGLTTLYHVVNQVNDNSIKNFKIEDYANVVTRGFIEGYYGNPWSVKDRADLMTYGGYYKLNAYFYAPKDDPKHRTKWRELYTAEELEWIKELADAGNASKTRFVYGIHPFPGNDAFKASTYEKDLSDLKAKLKQVIDQGVRQVAILADDFANPGGELGLRLVKDITNWLETDVKKEYSDMKTTLPYIPYDYMGNGSSNEFSYLKQAPENVQLVMTGGKIWGEVSQAFSQTFKNNTGRAPYYWINWPCSDNSKKHLIMGGNDTFLHPGVDPTLIEGIMLNPMQQSEANKSALFAVADYSWNIWDNKEQANKNWYDSFKYMDHNSAIETEASTALREISKHMINQNMDSRVAVLQESLELAPKLNAFKTKYESGANVKEDALALIDEFTKLKEAANYYKNNPGNQKTRDQIIYWLDCWEDTTTAVISYLKAVISNEEGNRDELWTNYSEGQSAFEKSKTYGFNYVDHLEYAEVGVQHIVPFIKYLGQSLSGIVSGIVDPSKVIATVITNRTDVPTGNLSNILDNNPATEVVYKTPNSIAIGTYIGVKYNTLVKITDVEFLMGAISNANDTMQEAKIQYTVDGKEWLDLETGKVYTMPNKITVDGLNLEAMGIRIIATKARSNTWLGIKDITINKTSSAQEGTSGFTYTVMRSSAWVIYQGTEANLYDGNDNTFVWYDPDGAGNANQDDALVGDYLGYDLGKVINLESTHIVVGNSGGDKLVKYAIETSVDNITWTPVEGYASYTGATTGKDVLDINLKNIAARYIRIKNLERKDSWIKFSEFTVKESPKYTDKYVYTNTDLELGSFLVSKELTKLAPKENITLKENEYIGIKLDSLKSLKEISVDISNKEGLILQTSVNGIEWINVDLEGATNLKDARYVRLLASKDVTFNLNKFEVKSNEIYPISIQSSFVNINGSVSSIFDKNFNTSASFDSYPVSGKSIVFDLGQNISIKNLTYAVLDTEINYLRDAKFQISLDGEDWTDVITIGDGIKNDSSDMNSKPGDAGYEHGTSTTVVPISHSFKKGELDEAKDARYIRILFTAGYDHRWVKISEILINDGEYIPSSDPRFISNPVEVEGFKPSNVIDGDLTTAYKPNTNNGEIKSGSLTYKISDKTNIKKINIVQGGTSASNAKVMVRTGYNEAGEEVWNQIGTLNKSLNEIVNNKYENIYAIRIDWEEVAPTIYEIVTINDYNIPNTNELEALIESSNEYSESNYTVGSFAKFTDALNKAKSIIENLGSSTQKDIDAAKEALTRAITELVSIEELSNIINEANEIKNNGEKYTEESLNNLNVALSVANEVLSNEEATNENVSTAVSNLRIAINALVKEVPVEVDKTLLSATIEYANNVKANGGLENVVPVVVKEFEAALAEANTVMNDKTATEESVNSAVDRLIKVIHMLDFKQGNKDELIKFVEIIKLLDGSKYTTSTWAILQNELVNANDVIADENAMEKEVSEAFEKLNEAYNNLQLIVVIDDSNKEEVTVDIKEINPGEENVIDIPVTEKPSSIEISISDTNSLLQSDGSLSLNIKDFATIKLPFTVFEGYNLDGADKVTFKLDVIKDSNIISSLNAVNKVFDFNLSIVNGEEIIKINKFNNGTVEVKLMLSNEDLDGLNRANLVVLYYNEETKKFEVIDSTINGNEVTFIVSHFSKYVIAEKEVVDKNKLTKLIDIINGLDEKAYIPSTWNVLKVSFEAANEVLNNDKATQEEVNKAYDDLIKAYLDLRLIPDKSKLEDLINKAEAIDVSKYTEESINNLKEKLSKVKSILDNKEATQEEVNNAESEIEVALADLEEKKDDNTSDSDDSGNVNNGGNTSGDTGNTDKNTGVNKEENSTKLPETGGTSAVSLITISLLLTGAGVALRKRR